MHIHCVNIEWKTFLWMEILVIFMPKMVLAWTCFLWSCLTNTNRYIDSQPIQVHSGCLWEENTTIEIFPFLSCLTTELVLFYFLKILGSPDFTCLSWHNEKTIHQSYLVHLKVIKVSHNMIWLWKSNEIIYSDLIEHLLKRSDFHNFCMFSSYFPGI